MRCNSAGTAAWKPCSGGCIPKRSSAAADGRSPRPRAPSWPPERFNAGSPVQRKKGRMTAGHRIFTIIAVALSSAAAVAAPAKKAPPPASGPNAAVKQLLDNCEAHKFETTVDATIDGEPHRSKVKLCGKDGQSDADWIGTLKDAIAKLDANKDMDASVRTQIETAINAEIARLQSAAAAQPAALANDPGFGKDASSIAGEYSALP